MRLSFRDAQTKIQIAGSVLWIFSSLFPFARIKQNRIEDGFTIGLWDSGSRLTVVLPAITLFYLLLAALDRRKSRFLYPGLSLILFAFPWAVLAFLGAHHGGGTAVRISPSSGFWLMVFSSTILIGGSLTFAETKGPLDRIFYILPLVLISLLILSGMLDNLSVMKEFRGNSGRFLKELLNHIKLTLTSVVSAVILGIPLGVAAARTKRAERSIFFVVNTVQTIPSLALFGLLIAPLSWLSYRFPLLREMGLRGIGAFPAVTALTLYALLPIALNTYEAISSIDPAVSDAARGMGMSRIQLLMRIKVPIAVPIIFRGIRTSAVQATGNTAVAALIGAGGLGVFVFQGLGQGAPDLILLGALPVIVLSVLVDKSMKFITFISTPRGLRDG